MSDEPRPMTILDHLEREEQKVHYAIGYLEMMVEMFDTINKPMIENSIISLIDYLKGGHTAESEGQE
jgi:hypothetical protein